MRLRLTKSEGIGIAGISATIIVGSIIVFFQPMTSDQIGIVGIVATIIIGITIFLMQRRADQNVNKIIHHEDARKKSIKRYFIIRIDSDYQRINRQHVKLKQLIHQYLGNRSDEKSWTDLTRFIDGEFVRWVTSFKTVTYDIAAIVPVLDNPRLIDKYSLIQQFSDQMIDAAKVLSDSRNRDNGDILKIQNEIDDTMKHVNWFWDALLEEVDHKLD
jgi:hypothetical protein